MISEQRMDGLKLQRVEDPQRLQIDLKVKHLHKHRSNPADREMGVDMQEDIENYLDMQLLNPDWDYAAKHAKASRPGLKGKYHEKEECICCFKQINKDPVPLCQNSKELQFLGFGFPLYFIFLKFAIIILMLLIVNYTAIELYWAIFNNYDFCTNHVTRTVHGVTFHCTSFMVLLATIDQQLPTEEHILRLSSFVTLLLALIYVRDHFTKTWRYYDQRQANYDNFAIYLENLPTKAQIAGRTIIGKRLREFFADQNIFPEKPRIAHVNLIGQFQRLQEYDEERKQLMHKLEKMAHQNADLKEKYKKQSISQDQRNKIFAKKSELKIKKKQMYMRVKEVVQKVAIQKQRLKKQIQEEDIDCDKAIICFQTQKQKEKVLDRFKTIHNSQLRQYFYQAGNKIEAGKSARPREIDWEFINVSQSIKLKKRIASWVIFILILGALTVGIYFLFNWKSTLVIHADRRDATIIVIVSIIGIIIFNKFAIAPIIHHLVEFEMRKTGVGYQFSFMLKYSLGLFFTTAVMTILVEGATHDNVYEEHWGIVEEQTLFYFMVAFVVPSIWAINPWYIWKWIQRKRHQNNPFFTQEEANQAMEDVEYIMGKRYGQILEAFWFVFLYASVIPIGSIFIVIGLSLFYWIDKYNLLRKSSITEGVSGDLCMYALKLLQLSLIIKPAGELIFDWLIRHNWHVIPVIEISIGFFYVILARTDVFDFFHEEKFMPATITYSELKKKNMFSYELYNPLSKEEELKKYYSNIEQCSNDEHKCHIKQTNPEKQENESVYKIVRPHKSAKKKVQLFSETDNGEIDRREVPDK